MKQLFYTIAITALLFTASACHTSAQTTKPTATPAQLDFASDSSKWIFTAIQALPQSGLPRYISANYTVNFTAQKLIVYLPYYGTATAGADVYSGRSPLDFTSQDFTIEKKQTKNGRWNITLKVKDYSEVRTLYFTFYDDGSANLNVNLSNRSPISFTGNVVAVVDKQ